MHILSKFGASTLPSVLLYLAIAATTTPLGLSVKAQEPSVANDKLEEVLVTASRRETLLEDLPASVSAVTANQIAALGSYDREAILLAVPGVAVTDFGAGRQDVTIRGINSLGSGDTTAFYLDEIPGSPDLRLVDIERVEVLRGPQGTLYGVSTMGGAVRTITRDPQFDGFAGQIEGDVSQTQSSDRNTAANLILNLPVIDETFGIRAVFYHERETGFNDNYTSTRVPGSPTQLGTLIKKNPADYEVNGARIKATYNQNRWKAVGTVIVQQEEYRGIDSEDADLGLGNFRQSRLFNEEQSTETLVGNLLLEVDIGWATAVSSTTISRADSIDSRDTTGVFKPVLELIGAAFYGVDASDVSYLNLSNDNSVEGFTQELRLTSLGDGPFQWIFGGFYSDNELEGQQTLLSPGATTVFGPDIVPSDTLFTFNPNTASEEISVFGELSYRLPNGVEAAIGTRRYRIDQGFDNSQFGLFNNFLDPSALQQDDNDSSEDGFIYRFSLSYRISENLMLYSNAASSYRAGGPNQIIPITEGEVPSSFQSDSLWQYETGFRLQLLDNTVGLNGSIYLIDWTDLQVSVPTPGGFSFFDNVGEAQTRGFELELLSQPIDGLLLSAAFTYNDAELQGDLPSVMTGKGQRIPFAQEYSYNINAEYDWAAFGDWRGFARLNYNYIGDRLENVGSKDSLGNIIAEPEFLDSYQKFDLGIGIRTADLSAVFYAENLSDERAVLGREDNLGIVRNFYLRPRTVGLRLTASF